MQTIHAFLCDDDLEARIAEAVATTTRLVRGPENKHELRRAFAELAKLKTQRTAIEVYRLERKIGLGGLV